MNARLGLILVSAIFLLPPIVATVLYKTGAVEGDLETGKNNGELIHPARPLQILAMHDATGQAITLKTLEGYWTLLQFAGDQCVGDCQKNIYKMHRIRVALGKDAHRVQKIHAAETVAGYEQLLADNPGTLIYSLGENSPAMFRQFPDYIEGDIASISGYLYIVDPLGNLAMRYPSDTEASPILKDLRHLLKATWIRPRDE